MNIEHEFSLKTSDVSTLFPSSTIEDFIGGIKSSYDGVSYVSPFDNIKSGFEAFSEGYLKFFSDELNISEIKRVTGSKVSFEGKDLTGNPVSIYSLFLDEDREITINRDQLTHFAQNSFEHIKVKSPKNMFVITNGKKVNEQIMLEAPYVKDFRYIFIDEINRKTAKNMDFWLSFRKSLSRNIDSHRSPYIEREFQLECISKMNEVNKGKIILPPSSGKSIIMASFTLREILKNSNKTPVFIILSPRIILSYQLLNVFFKHLTNNKINAQYCNLCSGDMSGYARKMCEKMKAEGLLNTPVETSKNIQGIRKHLERAVEQKIPIIISSTYHSGWRLENLKKEIDTVFYDECHNLIMGRFSEDFKEDCLNIESTRKFFFTATPCNTASENGRGNNNVDLFGKIIYTKSHAEMIDSGEILPVKLHTISVNDYLILKNKDEDFEDNIKKADFDRDCTVKSRAIIECHKYHDAIIKKDSLKPILGGKIIVTINGSSTLKGIRDSKEISEFINNGGHVFAISTELKYWHNGSSYIKSNFKEQFIEDTNALKDEDKAIILHIDMLGEGLNNEGITGVMAFSVMGVLKTIQLIGRVQRLHPFDRDNFYNDKIPSGCDRNKFMVKPYGYMMVPVFLRDSNDIREESREFLRQIHGEYGFIPEMIYSNSKDPGDNENLTNIDFKSKYEKYEILDFTQEIEDFQKGKKRMEEEEKKEIEYRNKRKEKVYEIIKSLGKPNNKIFV